MTAGNSHRILRQVLELDLATPLSEAPGLQEQAAKPFREGTFPGLEALFDRVAGPGRLLHLERIEVDLGELRGPDWPEQLVERLADRLRETLPEADVRLAPGSATWEPEPSRAAQSSLEKLLFFLIHGRLPWWGTRPADGWSEELAATFSTEEWTQLGNLLRSDPQASRRLVEVAGDRFLAGTVAALMSLDGTDQVLRLLARKEKDPGSEPYRSSRSRFWAELLELALAAPQGPDTGARLLRRRLGGGLELVKEPGLRATPFDVQRELELAHPGSAGVSPASSGQWAEGPTFLEGRRQEQGQGSELRNPSPDAVVTEDVSRRDAGGPRGRKPQPGSTNRTASASEPWAGPRPLREPADQTTEAPLTAFHPAKSEAVDLPGTGAVILHPFLPELFGSRGLLVGPLFRDEVARHHAVHLLGHLTFGVEAPEYDLLLPKLLCGMAWEELLPPSELGDDDHAACDELLAAVLGHWQALRSTSAAWLREQFFLRDGQLKNVDHGWQLTVERRAQDVLLDRLPWGLGTIRLPWLTEVLHVRWTDP